MPSAGKGFRIFQEGLLGKKEARKAVADEKKIKKYVTGKKKGSLAGDLVNYGVPALTGAIGGAIGGLAGGFGGVAGSAIGAKIGKEYIAPQINKVAGFRYGGAVGKTGMALIHKNEFVLPVGVNPTASQRRKVAVGKNGAGTRVMFV